VYREINIDLQNNERIVSLTMLSQKGAFLGFHIVTEDGYGNSKSSLAGFLFDDMILDASNMDTTFQVRIVIYMGEYVFKGTAAMAQSVTLRSH
jgi:accessory colonization factor AcfC